MRVLQVNQSDREGGAARAALRIHRALLDDGIDSLMLVNAPSGLELAVSGPHSRWERLIARAKPQIVKPLLSTIRTENSTIHSAAVFNSRWVDRINGSDASVVNLHWTCGEMLSIEDIGRIEKPVVWTLHDMWPFCGAEHYTENRRWEQGYRRDNRAPGESGFDLNRWTWLRKRKHWQRPLHIVTPSQWLADCVRRSALMGDWPLTVVPNAIDTNWWKPLSTEDARQQLGLPSSVPLLLFGAIGGGKDPRKGFDLLLEALEHFRHSDSSYGAELVVFGQTAANDQPDLGFPVHYMGHVDHDEQLRALYNAADVLIVPSRQDNLPNTCVEAHACGLPVVAFNVGGLPDIVAHRSSGHLAEAFKTEDLAAGIGWAVEQRAVPATRAEARVRSLKLFSTTSVAARYRALYEVAVQQ